MDLTAFVYYLALFRLAIIAAGITSIVLGYKLFARGIFPTTSLTKPTQSENVTAEIAGARFTLKNAAPGTCFALFGMIIIITMFLTGGPEVTLELLEKGYVRAKLRGGEIEEVQSYSNRALDSLEKGKIKEASETVHEALDMLSEPLNNFAWVLLKTGHNSPTTGKLAEIAVFIKPNNANFLHTLAEIQFEKGNKQEALHLLEKAQTIDPVFNTQLEKWREHIGSK